MSVLPRTLSTAPSAAPSAAPSGATSACGGSAAFALRGRPQHAPAVPPDAGLPAVVGADLRVPTLSGTTTYANLDHAASTPALVRVKQAVDRALETYASVHRGAGYASRLTSAWYEQARDEVGRFVGARRGHRRLHPHHDRLVGPAVQGTADPHDGVRLRF